MKFFIDSGDIGEIKEAAAMGAIDGVTTNPSLLAKGGLSTKKAIAQIWVDHDWRGPSRGIIEQQHRNTAVNRHEYIVDGNAGTAGVILAGPLQVDGRRS